MAKEIKNKVEAEGQARESGIVVLSPEQFRPKALPLIIRLPEDASAAQVERARVLNAYAYQHPEKWEARKEVLLKELESLKNAPDPIVNQNVRLSVGPKAPTNTL